MSSSLHYTDPALADLDGIFSYTLNKWGRDQARRYIDTLESCCEEIARGDAVTRAFVADDVQCRVCRCEHHYIFYSNGERTRILAVLHEKMDLIVRLGKRLQSMQDSNLS